LTFHHAKSNLRGCLPREKTLSERGEFASGDRMLVDGLGEVTGGPIAIAIQQHHSLYALRRGPRGGTAELGVCRRDPMTDKQARSVRHDRSCRILSRRKRTRKCVVDGWLTQDIAPPVGRPGKAALPYPYMWETRGNWLTAGEIFFGRCRWTRNRDSPVQSRDRLYLLTYVTASAVVVTSSEVAEIVMRRADREAASIFAFALISGQTRASYEMLAGTPPDRAH
jgi:hypothetical protein